MRVGYRLIEHPSDAGIEAGGATMAEAFARAAEGLMSVVVDPASVDIRESRSIAVAGSDEERLLVRWLGEVLWLYDGAGFVSRSFSVSRLSGTALTAEAFGEPLDATKHRLRLDVKAVTYHGLLIRRTARRCTVRVFLDI